MSQNFFILIIMIIVTFHAKFLLIKFLAFSLQSTFEMRKWQREIREFVGQTVRSLKWKQIDDFSRRFPQNLGRILNILRPGKLYIKIETTIKWDKNLCRCSVQIKTNGLIRVLFVMGKIFHCF